MQAKAYLLIAMLLFMTIISISPHAAKPFTQTTLIIKQSPLYVLIANTHKSRVIGLSKHTELKPNHGMLFIYTKSLQRGFTMKKTQIPLSIAFIDDNYIINQILKMQPLEAKIYQSNYKIKYALEVQQGWFEEHEINVGERVELTLP